MEIDRATLTIDRSQDQFPGSSSSRKVNEEEREAAITGLIASVVDSPSNSTEGDKPPLRSFYTSSHDHSSASSTCPLSSSTPNQMAGNTLHSYSSSSTESDLTTPAPPMVASSPVPLLSPPAHTRDSPSKPKVLCLSGGEYLKAEGDGLTKLIPGRSEVGVKPSAGKKTPKSVSRLCFPFVMTTPKGKDKDRKLVLGARNALPASASASAVPVTPAAQLASTSPHHHKYSCAPTRFCPFPTRKVALVQKHQRHAYTNRGYSHEALGYVKWFWGARREGLKSGGSKPYLGKKPHLARTVHPSPTHSTQSNMSKLPPASTRASVPTSCTETPPDLSEEKTIPASIHPRRGDISALRDPLCAEVDKTFGALGVWTVAKMVWMFEVDVGMRKWKREREKEDQRRRSWLRVRILWDEERDGDGSLDLSTRSTSSSSISDDSETTLVEDDSLSSVSFSSPFSSLKEEEECSSDDEDVDDRLQLVIRGRQLTSQSQSLGCASCSRTSTTPSVSPGRELELDLEKSNVGRFLPRPVFQTRVEAFKLTGCSCCQHEWATDWMSRWDIIRNLLHSS